ncbi:Ribosome small subunit biogenesis RbfA-release protein RsgA [hydrothermal vent metagenome]|uniref:Ribosome small subunit biogenesis RbfA-release protein RsgA n=1 Tax=hydrothermal vent metagenome TaxID=652676 RepID=A0A3B0ZIW8_9ZZZZ
MSKDDKKTHHATVIASYGNQCKIETADKQLLTAKSLKSIGKPLCGDKISYKNEQNNEMVITEILPRSSILSRRNNLNPKPKQIASNIDQMIIVVSVNDSIKYGLIDRYLIAATFSNFTPVIVLNKVDLLDKDKVEQLKINMQNYSDINISLFYISAKSNEGVDALLTTMADKTNIVVGQSGVGKSSIVNAILPEQPALTKEISDSTNKGKHTTTTAYLYTIPNNGKLIDSPGIREFGLWNIEKNELAQGFREIQQYSEQCKFRNCLHHAEPSCAVVAAVNEGTISKQRYESYLSIFESIDNS